MTRDESRATEAARLAALHNLQAPARNQNAMNELEQRVILSAQLFVTAWRLQMDEEIEDCFCELERDLISLTEYETSLKKGADDAE